VRVGLDDEEDLAALRVRRGHADRDGLPRDAQLHAQPAFAVGHRAADRHARLGRFELADLALDSLLHRAM
jgi:hypothetical protein